MSNDEIYRLIKFYYEHKIYTREIVEEFYQKGTITKEQLDDILKEE